MILFIRQFIVNQTDRRHATQKSHFFGSFIYFTVFYVYIFTSWHILSTQKTNFKSNKIKINCLIFRKAMKFPSSIETVLGLKSLQNKLSRDRYGLYRRQQHVNNTSPPQNRIRNFLASLYSIHLYRYQVSG